MGILSFSLGIENLGLLKAFPHLFVIGNRDTFFIFGMGWETMFDDFLGFVRTFFIFHWFYIYIYIYFFFFLYHCCLPNNVYFLIFVALDHPELEDQHCSRVRVAFAFACEIEDFDDLIDPCHFFDCCLGLEPSKYMLEKIR